MRVADLDYALIKLVYYEHKISPDTQVRICVGNYLYDIDHINTSIDMDTDKPNIVIYVKEK